MRHTSETTNVDSTFYPNLGSYGIRLPEIEGGLLSGLASGWLDKEVAKAKGTRFTLPRCKLLVNWGGAKEVFGPDSRRDGNSNSSCEMSGASASTYEHAQWSFPSPLDPWVGQFYYSLMYLRRSLNSRDASKV